MNLTDALDTLSTSLQTELPGWNINFDEIDYPEDKLIDLLYDTFNFSYVDMGTRAYVGRLSFVLYREYKHSYQELLDAVDTLLKWLDDYSHSEIQIGNNTETIADVGLLDGTFDDITRFRVVTITVPFEILA